MAIRRGVGDRSTRISLMAVGGLAIATAGAAYAAAPHDPQPDFGPNVLVFSPSMPAASIQKQIDQVYAVQQHSEFGPQRNAFLFLPGDYKVDIPVGFYTEVIGLGSTPDSVHITGNVHADASLPHDNATCTFWRAVEGFSVTPTGGTLKNTMQWAVSQAVPMRRMHIQGNIVLHQNGGWASGGWMSDTLVDGNVDSGTQQQWISRNSEWGSWTGSNWNMVFVGVPHPPKGEWPQPTYTKIAETPVIREKPFLQVDASGQFSVRVPALVRDSIGITWHNGATPGNSIPIDRFYIAHAGVDTAASINAQLDAGKNLLLMPGTYDLVEPIRVHRPETIVMGIGFATLRPTQGTAAMTVDDADGIIIAGLLFDAGEKTSPILLQVGAERSSIGHAQNPISLHDVFFRDGGAAVGRVKANLTVNSNDTLVDHTWIWRADHGSGVGWDLNNSTNGLIVNGDNVTAYGLFVEHHQEFQVVWNGDRGRTYFYQSEIPYDPPNQASFTSAPGTKGWASYKVADQVKTHEAWGLGVYSVFRHPNVTLTRAIEVPRTPEIKFHHMITLALDNLGEISHVIDGSGGPTSTVPRVSPKVAEFP